MQVRQALVGDIQKRRASQQPYRRHRDAAASMAGNNSDQHAGRESQSSRGLRLQLRITPNDRTRHSATTEIIWGTSAHSIVNYATERGMDLIVMGTHGRGGVAHLLSGSVAEKVVRHAPCPVMTVRQAPARTVRLPELLQTEWIQAGG